MNTVSEDAEFILRMVMNQRTIEEQKLHDKLDPIIDYLFADKQTLQVLQGDQIRKDAQ